MASWFETRGLGAPHHEDPRSHPELVDLILERRSRVSKDEATELEDALARLRAKTYSPSRKIFDYFRGNFSVTVKGSLTPITQAFQIQTNLFWNATGRADEA